jgi:hypothetical protein
VTEKLTPNGDINHVSAPARFVLAALCCGVFVLTVIVFIRMTAGTPRTLLQDVSFTFWGVIANFALCLGVVAYVSRRLHKARVARAKSP